jgi:hypothetical protein
MKRCILFVLGILLISTFSFSQDKTFSFQKNQAYSAGDVRYLEDSRTKQLIDFLSSPLPPENTTQMEGFRVQIYFSNDKQLVDEQRTKFISLYPSFRTYLHYEAPNYLIKVGNFRTEVQAAGFRNMVSSEFPASIIQKDNIELPSREESVFTTPTEIHF